MATDVSLRLAGKVPCMGMKIGLLYRLLIYSYASCLTFNNNSHSQLRSLQIRRALWREE